MGRCCCCNKETDIWHSNQLKDGEICDDCYGEVSAKSYFDKQKLSKSTCAEVRKIFTNKDTPEKNILLQPLTQGSGGADYSPPAKEHKRKSVLGIFFNFLETVAAIVCLYLWLSGNYVTVCMDLMAYVNEDNPSENPYIQMVYTSVPEGTSKNWGTAFSKALPVNRWTYFKSDGVRYVVVTSKFDQDDTDTLETYFMLTPLEEKGTFWIEMCLMRFDGKELSDLEQSAVLATLYEEDLSNLVADYILDSIF